MITLKSFFTLPIHDWRQLWYHIDSHRVFWWTLQLSHVLGVLLPWPLWVMETRCGGGLVWVGYDQRVFPNVGISMEIPRATSGRVILGSCWSCWRLTRLSIVNNRSGWSKSFKEFMIWRFWHVYKHWHTIWNSRSKAKHADPKFWWAPLVSLENLKLSVV